MRVSPFLSMLLAKKRPTDEIPYDDPNDPIPESVDAGPTIPIRRAPQSVTPIAQETRPRTTGVSTGLTDPGNLNPFNRPVLKNPDGSISTSSAIGTGTERGETIIPTVVDGLRLTPEQALLEFRKTGGNFGSYGTVEQGDTAATALHNDQAAYLAANGIGTNGNDTRARTVATPTIAVKPRTAVEEAADTVRKYDDGLHPDPKTGAWVPHKRNKGLQILEGLGNVAASGVGINLQNILHPRGTPEQQARRRLADESAIEDQNIQRQRAAVDVEGDKATIALRSAQSRKIQDLLDHPDTSDADKRKLEVAKAILQSHPQGFDPNDPADAVALKKMEDAGIPVPASYGKQPKGEAGFSLNPGEARYDSKGNLIVERPGKPEKPPDEVPDTAGPIGELEGRFRANAAKAQTAAEEVEAKVKQYTAEQARTIEKYDPAKDPNVASLTAEARRQREFAQDQLKKADDLAVKKVEAGNKANTQRGKGRQQGSPVPATHSFSISAYIKRNKGATEADARAFAAKIYPGFEIVP